MDKEYNLIATGGDCRLPHSIISTIMFEELRIKLLYSKERVAFPRKLNNDIILRKDIASVEEGHQLVLSYGDVVFLTICLLGTLRFILSPLVDRTPSKVPEFVLLIIFLVIIVGILRSMKRVIVVRLKDGKKYIIPYNVFRQSNEEKRKISEIMIQFCRYVK